MNPPVPSCVSAVLLVSLGPGSCVEGEDGSPACEYAQEAVNCVPYGGCEAGACVEPPLAPAAGQLVISEVQRDSSLDAPDVGEWIEFKNVSDTTLDVTGCTLTDDGDDTWTLNSAIPQWLDAGDTGLVARSADLGRGGEVTADHVWTNVELDNLFDEVVLKI